MISPKGICDPQSYFQTKIKQIQETTHVSRSMALLLYKKFGSIEIIIDQWQQNTEEILKSLHIAHDSNNELYNLEMKNIGQGECPICSENTEIYQLYCGHKLCKNCLAYEIMTFLNNNQVPICRGQCENNTLCGAEIILQDINNLFSNSLDAIKTYNLINTKDLIQKDPNVRSCPQCKSIITNDHKIGDHFGCCPNCYSFTCFKCHDDFHCPLKCGQIKDFLENQKQVMDQLEEDQNSWFFREKRCQQYRRSHRDQFERYFNDLIEKAKLIGLKEVDKINQEKSLYNNIVSSSDFDFQVDQYKRFIFSEAYQKLNFAFNDEETINVITTRCPNCHEYVERNGGCNHMQCICGCQFCFSCGQVWDSSHSSYKCPKYASRTETRNGKSQCGIDFSNTNDQNFYPPPMDQEKRKLFVSYKNLRILYQQCKEKYDNLEKELISSNVDSPKNKLIKIFLEKYDELSSSNFANKIINTALFGKKVVMYGYPAIFYISTKDNDTKNLEFHLNKLDKEVENLLQNIKCLSNCEMNFYQQLIDSIHEQLKCIINICEQY